MHTKSMGKEYISLWNKRKKRKKRRSLTLIAFYHFQSHRNVLSSSYHNWFLRAEYFLYTALTIADTFCLLSVVRRYPQFYSISVPQPVPDNQLYIPVLEYKQNPQNYGRSVIPGHIQIALLPADIIRIGKFRIFSVDDSISGVLIHSPVLPVSIEFFQYYPLSFLTTSLPRQIFLIFQFSYISPIWLNMLAIPLFRISLQIGIFKLVYRNRLWKIIPLIYSASHLCKLINLLLCFNPLRDNGKTKCFGEWNDRIYNGHTSL